MTLVERVNDLIKDCKFDPTFEENQISDGYHTFEELYEFRKLYNAALFNEWAKEHMIVEKNKAKGIRYLYQPSVKYGVHKSKRHYDGEECFGGGWFIVMALLPDGQISNHYKMEDWELFQIPEKEKASFEFDGHTPQDVLKRLKNLIYETK